MSVKCTYSSGGSQKFVDTELRVLLRERFEDSPKFLEYLKMQPATFCDLLKYIKTLGTGSIFYKCSWLDQYHHMNVLVIHFVSQRGKYGLLNRGKITSWYVSSVTWHVGKSLVWTTFDLSVLTKTNCVQLFLLLFFPPCERLSMFCMNVSFQDWSVGSILNMKLHLFLPNFH